MVRAIIEKYTLFGRTLVRITTKTEKSTLFVGFWLEKKKEKKNTPFMVGLLLE